MCDSGYASYYYFGPTKPNRNLLGSDLVELLRGAHTAQIFSERLLAAIGGGGAGVSLPLAHELARVYQADYILSPYGMPLVIAHSFVDQWRKSEIVCRRCLSYLHDGNVGESHMCKDCIATHQI